MLCIDTKLGGSFSFILLNTSGGHAGYDVLKLYFGVTSLVWY